MIGMVVVFAGMMKRTIKSLVLAVSLGALLGLAPGQTDDFFNEADSFFQSYVSGGGVDYALIKSQPTKLKSLVAKMEVMDLTGASANTKKAFWINAYNITTIKAIIANYPTKSPMDIGGFFDTKKHKVAGRMITLNDIENKMIRPVYNDPRIHFVLVCAAKGCPPIYNRAYKPASLDQQLDARTKKAMNSTYFIRVKGAEKKVLISEIFKWYRVDFPKSLISYMNQYREKKIPADYKVGYYTYDWNLNQKKK
jgi:hypothetical protein